MKVVITIIGKDRVGIVAMASNVLAENQVNIFYTKTVIEYGMTCE